MCLMLGDQRSCSATLNIWQFLLLQPAVLARAAVASSEATSHLIRPSQDLDSRCGLEVRIESLLSESNLTPALLHSQNSHVAVCTIIAK